MKLILVTILALAALPSAYANDRGKLIFENKFDRNESQETTEEIGNGWISLTLSAKKFIQVTCSRSMSAPSKWS